MNYTPYIELSGKESNLEVKWAAVLDHSTIYGVSGSHREVASSLLEIEYRYTRANMNSRGIEYCLVLAASLLSKLSSKNMIPRILRTKVSDIECSVLRMNVGDRGIEECGDMITDIICDYYSSFKKFVIEAKPLIAMCKQDGREITVYFLKPVGE